MGIFNFRKRSNFDGPPPREKKLAYLIHQDQVPILAAEFVRRLESGESATWCKCLWRIHPDDQGTSPGSCRECGDTQGSIVHHGKSKPEFNHQFKGIRKTLVDTNAQCPVHTKEGMLLTFLEWATHGRD